jgi:polyhydroxybutyrate depolymerase
VVFYTILEGGHSWPGGKPLPKWIVGNTTQSIDATRVMWDFFTAHPLVKK